jgi:hypothetical protein
MSDLASVLARLRTDGPDSPAARLAALVVEDVLSRPVEALVEPAAWAEGVRDALRALTASDAAEAVIVARAELAATELAAEKRAFLQIVPASLRAGAKALAEVPMTPRRDAVMKLLDRDPLKQLLRAQIVATLIDFGRKAASPVADNPIARGLGGISKLVASKPSALGRVASAVSGEVERQVEKRATDFADTAVAEVLDGIADHVSDPARVKEQAAVRASLVDGLLESTGADLAELVRGHAPAQVAAARKALAAWVAEPAFLSDVQSAIAKAIEKEAKRPLGDVLADLALRDVVKAHAVKRVEKGVRDLVAGEAFGQWLGDLLGAP